MTTTAKLGLVFAGSLGLLVAASLLTSTKGKGVPLEGARRRRRRRGLRARRKRRI